MFDIGFWEFALIGVIALIVVGPERMPAIARKAGHYIGKAKKITNKIQEDISTELDTDTLKEQLNFEDQSLGVGDILQDTKNTLNDIKDSGNKD